MTYSTHTSESQQEQLEALQRALGQVNLAVSLAKLSDTELDSDITIVIEVLRDIIDNLDSEIGF